ncbi:MAG: hypothetical protein Kow0073_10190 [Immundisolibacter sp.]
MTATVLRLADIDAAGLESLLGGRGLTVVWLAPQADIPGSYWGGAEAGLVDDRLYVRTDTPVHSALHEACHWLCMDASRRVGLHTDAGGDDLEECAVCYLQIVLADRLPGVGGRRLMRDMDAWGYSFRLGSAQAWFEQDAADARAWLVERGLLPVA